jgi:hypothetical protein
VHGQCWRERSKFRIRVSSAIAEEHAIDVLVHEWGHALAWNYARDRMPNRKTMSRSQREAVDHGPEWGVAYSKVYATLVGSIIPII